MAFNNSFQPTYTPMYAPQQYIPQPQVQAPAPAPAPAQNSNMIWVSGEAGAKAYLVAPNTTVQLWDSEAQTIYLKSADGSGMPTMKVLDYTIREQAQNNPTMPTLMQDAIPEYVTKSEFAAFEEKVQKQIDRVAVKRREKREVEDDE